MAIVHSIIFQMTGEKKKNFSSQALLKSINSEESPDFSKDQHILKRQPGFFFFLDQWMNFLCSIILPSIIFFTKATKEIKIEAS